MGGLAWLPTRRQQSGDARGAGGSCGTQQEASGQSTVHVIIDLGYEHYGINSSQGRAAECTSEHSVPMSGSRRSWPSGVS